MQVSSFLDESGQMKIAKISDGLLKNSDLKNSDVFILDDSSNLFVWVGKNSNLEERKKAQQYGDEYIKKVIFQHFHRNFIVLSKCDQNSLKSSKCSKEMSHNLLRSSSKIGTLRAKPALLHQNSTTSPMKQVHPNIISPKHCNFRQIGSRRN